ncbi:P-loop containing nucleoside triphosphate hydrolase protein [Mycena epipterygia]|nr:P-loop containing nucleoside triphosphate hydrolase protein [Mycena epipterygia]
MSPSRPTSGISSSPTSATSQSNSDWVGRSLLTAKTIVAGAESLPFPYVKGVFGIAVVILETIDRMKKNREDLKELCGDTLEIMKIMQDQISAHGETAAVKFKSLCEDLEVCLQDVLHAVRNLQVQSGGFRSRFREIVKLATTTDEISRYQNRLRTLRSNFVVHKLTAQASDVSVAQVTPSINNCPPPSRIFHGRQTILDKMHQYFTADLGKQHIFLLHGLGCAGKTQIALKFIEQSSSQFSDIFLLDTSPVDTIDTGLKTIAVAKNIGTTSQEALHWLSCEQNWLLFFDNADDPKINLNRFFPQCNHGNILITSRNPGLRIYAGSHSLVSDMEETDATKLLLTCSAEEITPANTQELSCLPLAIIQAGAFIAKSGDLGSYLE